MPDAAIPPEVLALIAAHISSVARLEILLLLQTNPKQAWTPEQIARELRIEPAGAHTQLAALHASGLIALDAGPPPASPMPLKRPTSMPPSSPSPKPTSFAASPSSA